MSTTSFRLDNDLLERFERTANRLSRSKGWVINEALRQFVEREEKRHHMLKETEEAIADIEASQVVSGEAVMEWLATWGTPDEREAPKV